MSCLWLSKEEISPTFPTKLAVRAINADLGLKVRKLKDFEIFVRSATLSHSQKQRKT